MKKHRWVISVLLPAKFIKNEDGIYQVATVDIARLPEYQGPAFCFDCEQLIDVCWGEPCPGHPTTGGRDENYPDRYWENI